MTNIQDVIQHITAILTKVAIIAVVAFIMLIVLYIVIKYRGKNFRDSQALQQSLLSEVDEHHDNKRTTAVNSTVHGATVAYNDGRNKVILKIPTKQWWQLTTKAEIAAQISKKLRDDGFQLFLQSRFADYRFSAVTAGKDCFTLIGVKQHQ